ncbi:single-stranded DNA-binding protein [Microbacterium sp.]|uniref:single-stranded DNA-binding protein n=1 Tax=Microbacterium sp. TaxID=51671 RepID=UPI003A8834D0
MAEHITLVGTVGTVPERRSTHSGLAIAGFRIACNRTRWDRTTSTWVDDGTSWYSVSAYRSLAENVLESVSKGERVIVTGRLRLKEWEANGRRGVDAELDADAIGHDLLWGVTTYRRTAGARSEAAAPTRPHEGWAAPGADHAVEEWQTAGPGEPGGVDGPPDAAAPTGPAESEWAPAETVPF